MVPWFRLTGLVVTRSAGQQHLCCSSLCLCFVMQPQMSNGPFPSDSDSLSSPHFPITVSALPLFSPARPARAGTITPFIPPSLPPAREKWFLSKYPFRGAQVWTEPHGPGLERKISINIGTLDSVTSNHGAVTAGWAGW